MAFVTAYSENGIILLPHNRTHTPTRPESVVEATAAPNKTIYLGKFIENYMRATFHWMASEPKPFHCYPYTYVAARRKKQPQQQQHHPTTNEWKMNTKFYRLQKLYCFRLNSWIFHVNHSNGNCQNTQLRRGNRCDDECESRNQTHTMNEKNARTEKWIVTELDFSSNFAAFIVFAQNYACQGNWCESHNKTIAIVQQRQQQTAK